MISQEAIQKILGIREKVSMSADEMVKEMKVAFYPIEGIHVSENVRSFNTKIKECFQNIGVEIVDYQGSLEHVPASKRIQRIVKIVANNARYVVSKALRLRGEFFYINLQSIKRVIRSQRLKKGVSVIVLGELHPDTLPMQFISSFKHNSIIHILDFPKNIKDTTLFEEHFDTAMSLFAYHMANIVIAVDDQKWMVYNFNASHPIYQFSDGKLEEHVKHALIPKIVAPISPHRFSEFKIAEDRFSTQDASIKSLIDDMSTGAKLFDKTRLFPEGKKIDSLPFRDNFHKHIGKLHLDNRSGMSFGFISKQMPIKPGKILTLDETKQTYGKYMTDASDYFIDAEQNIHIVFEIPGKGTHSIQIPDVWVLTLRSGSNKTNFNPNKDLLLLGLSSKGDMWMKFPEGVKIHEDYKPSFDTKVILAHAVGNAIISSILNFLDPASEFVKKVEESGISISHWHGYFREDLVPGSCMVYGFKNLHVACSSPQSAIYALGGKLTSFMDNISNSKNYKGDVHIEPHHGSNISFLSLTELGEYLINNPEASKLGNIYLKQ